MNAKKLTINDLDEETEARWITLLYAIDTLNKFCKDNKKDFNTIEIKIPAIKHYMAETVDTVKVMMEDNKRREQQKTFNKLKNRLTTNLMTNIRKQNNEYAKV